MKWSRNAIKLSVLLVICLILHFYGADAGRVENEYSNGYFLKISGFLRSVFGKLPFSAGDIIYGLLVAWMLWNVGKFLFGILKRGAIKPGREFYLRAGYGLLVFCSVIYILFNGLWGINYDRKGIAYQLQLEMKKYAGSDLIEINNLLIGKVNGSKEALLKRKAGYPDNRELYRMVDDAYQKVSVQYPFLRYHPVSIKTSMWGWLGNYTGFTGYYNPFTGEAQLNTTIPEFLQPFIACHEVAHQLGYAKENEASFVGYLAASHSGDPLLQYSVYLELFIYANRNLNGFDSLEAKRFRKTLSADVLKDLKLWATFNRNHRSFAEPLISWVYDKYLMGNRQPGGILSYDEVTGFVISYYKKYGRL